MDFRLIRSAEELEHRVLQLGFLPLFANRIEGFSVEEMTPDELWFADGVDGPWEWKGPVIRNWRCAYGKFYNGKACFVSLDWFPDFINYRRSKFSFYNSPIDSEGRNREKIVYETIESHEVLLTRDIRRLSGIYGKRIYTKNPLERMIKKANRPKFGGEGFETVLTRLQMATLVCTADFEYARTKSGKEYGWGLALYTTPELLYERDFSALCEGRSPQQSYDRLLSHMRQILPNASLSDLQNFLR